MQEKDKKSTGFIKNIDWKMFRLISVFYGVIIVVMIIILINIANRYKAQGVYVPSENVESSSLSSLAGSLGGLAGMAGIDLGGSNRDNMKMAIEIIKSKQFIYSIITENNLAVELFAAEGWDIDNNQIIINPKLFDINKGQWIRDVKFPKKPQPSDFELYKFFKKSLNVFFDDKTKLLKISFEHYSPHFAKKVINSIVDSINSNMQNREIREASVSIQLIEESISKTKFAEIKVLLYELIQEQTKRLLLAKTKEFFVLEPIDPPIIEEEKSFPKRGLILIVFTLLYGVLALLLLFIRNTPKDA